MDTAVFQAFKAVEVAVRDAIDAPDKLVGTQLMREAFNASTGALRDDTVPEVERESLAHLAAGAIGSYKNPHSHRTVVLKDATDAVETVMLASHLLRIVDARRP